MLSAASLLKASRLAWLRRTGTHVAQLVGTSFVLQGPKSWADKKSTRALIFALVVPSTGDGWKRELEVRPLVSQLSCRPGYQDLWYCKPYSSMGLGRLHSSALSCSWYCSFQSCISIGIPHPFVAAGVTAGGRQLFRQCYNPWPGVETLVAEIQQLSGAPIRL